MSSVCEVCDTNTASFQCSSCNKNTCDSIACVSYCQIHDDPNYYHYVCAECGCDICTTNDRCPLTNILTQNIYEGKICSICLETGIDMEEIFFCYDCNRFIPSPIMLNDDDNVHYDKEQKHKIEDDPDINMQKFHEMYNNDDMDLDM